MKRIACLLVLGASFFARTNDCNAEVIAQWTFETSVPLTGGPLTPEVGSGTATSDTGGTFSNPVGNGSAESWASNGWAVNERFQFTVDLTGRENIGVSFDQTSSGTGPRDFALAYQVNGGGFINFASYVVLPNQTASPGLGNWNSTTAIPGYTFTFDLSSVTAINNAAVVDFALINTSTVSATGSTVAATGTSRVDNFTVSVVPEPGSMAMLAVAGIGGVVARRRMKKVNADAVAV